MSQLQTESVKVEDAGILLRGSDMTHRKIMIQHLVEQTRSVREACSLMQISYCAVWNMRNHVEDELGFPLVTRIRGGSAGSGSVLTKKGRAMMEAYDCFAEHMSLAAKELYGKCFSG